MMKLTYRFTPLWGDPWEVSREVVAENIPVERLARMFVRRFRESYNFPSERSLMFQAGAAWVKSSDSKEPFNMWPSGTLLFRAEFEGE